MATLGGFGPNRVFGGDFRITRLLGEGGMGAVYLADQQSTSTPRALKLMQRELVQDPHMRERFAQEARLGSRIASDHVAQVVAAGIDVETGIPWIAMELLRGLPLDRYLATRGPLAASEIRFLLEQLCHALGAAHAQGIVHRDLKPANVFLSVSRVVGLAYVVKVLDFGIAKVLAEAKTTRTAAVGTPLYMAPEQYQAGRVTPASDVWALGLMAFELLTGLSYWKAARGGDATPASIMFETCMAELRSPSARAAELGVEGLLPDGFDRWFDRCVNREPEGRFASASEAFDALAPLLGPAAPPAERLRLEAEGDTTTTTADRTEATPLPTDARRSAGSAESGATVAEPRVTLAQLPATAAGRGRTAAATAIATVSSWSRQRVGEQPTLRRKLGQALAVVGAGALATLVAMLIVAARQAPTSTIAEALQKIPAATGSAGASAAGAMIAAPSEFHAEGALSVHGRLAHRQVPPGERAETYVMLELRGRDQTPTTRAPVHLALVIDRSGSMGGARLRNAKAAALGAIDRLHDGDTVSVTAFDTQVLPLVTPTVLGATSRARVVAAIQSLGTGTDTCISCGLEVALAQLKSSPELVGRVLLLSDGEANVAVRDVVGFGRIGREAQGRDVSITTIGVGLDYNERILSALSRESNGRHYYADTESSLPRIFDAEAEALGGMVATGVEARIELAPGVELVALLDRAHRIEGSAVVVPLGQFARAEQKTVLMKVALAPHAQGAFPVCRIDVGLRSAPTAGAAKLGGELATFAQVGADLGAMDPAVEVRVQRSETARSLVKANELFASGRTGEADRELGIQADRLDHQKTLWISRDAKPSYGLQADLDDQARTVRDAREQYRSAAAARPPAVAARSAPARANARMRAMEAYDMSL
jgi:tRNA A-37 threonylcarbamoyl transferase component Bud32